MAKSLNFGSQTARHAAIASFKRSAFGGAETGQWVVGRPALKSRVLAMDTSTSGPNSAAVAPPGAYGARLEAGDHGERVAPIGEIPVAGKK